MKLAIMCSGQGLQSPEMFLRLESYPASQRVLERAVKSGVLDDSIMEWIDSGFCDSPVLYHNTHAQQIICLYQMMVWEYLKDLLPHVTLFAGYSLGELSMYGCSGAISLEQVLMAAKERSRMMSGAVAVPCRMAAVRGLSRDVLGTICSEHDWYIAIEDSAELFITGGIESTLTEFLEDCNRHGAEHVIELKIDIPSHTPLLAQASKKFIEYLSTVDFGISTKEILLAGVTGRRVYNAAQARQTLGKQISSMVRWRECLQAIIDYNCDTCLELGPGAALSSMLHSAYPTVKTRSVDEFKDLSHINDWVGSI